MTIPDVAAYYGVPYTWLLKRIKAWQIPVLKPNAALNLLWRDDALRLREFNRKAS
ncbi:hypothetical protein [Arsenicicoccus bolidensis]|uniref:hypothetical protein n=1 Tax=Arsenicicoccus bolidensis TaxID=229480 RepID=UPI0012EBEBD7|nr:hypothetical protein [Arsenicicoccus bolidensis]